MKIVDKRVFRLSLLQNLQPDYTADSIQDIQESVLISHGVAAIAFDIDSTIVGAGGLAVTEDVLAFIKNLQLPVFLTTNRRKPKGDALGEMLGAQLVVHATNRHRKPQSQYFLELFTNSGIELDRICLVGDRLFTDVLGGNRAGLTTIHVAALGKDPWYLRITGLRYIETIVTKLLSHNT